MSLNGLFASSALSTQRSFFVFHLPRANSFVGAAHYFAERSVCHGCCDSWQPLCNAGHLEPQEKRFLLVNGDDGTRGLPEFHLFRRDRAAVHPYRYREICYSGNPASASLVSNGLSSHRDTGHFLVDRGETPRSANGTATLPERQTSNFRRYARFLAFEPEARPYKAE